jgi:hypothetical protein
VYGCLLSANNLSKLEPGCTLLNPPHSASHVNATMSLRLTGLKLSSVTVDNL